MNITTFYGDISFAPTGENIAKSIYTIQILNGSSQIVSPLQDASTSLVYPIPWNISTFVTTSSQTTQVISTTGVQVTTSSYIPTNEIFQYCRNVSFSFIVPFQFEFCWDLEFTTDCQLISNFSIDGVVFSTDTTSFSN